MLALKNNNDSNARRRRKEKKVSIDKGQLHLQPPVAHASCLDQFGGNADAAQKFLCFGKKKGSRKKSFKFCQALFQ